MRTRKLCYVIDESRTGSKKGVWYYFNDVVWEKDALGALQDILYAFLESKFEKHVNKPTEKDVALYKHYKSYSKDKNKKSLFNVLERGGDLGGLFRIVAQANDFDKKPHLFAYKNGVLDMDKGVFNEKGDPKDMLMHQAADTEYNQEQDEEINYKLRKHLKDIFSTDEITDWMLAYCGWCKRGDNIDRKMMFLWGDGANGKTLFINLLRRAFGEYGISFGVQNVLLDKNEKAGAPNSDFNRIRGRRIVCCSEPSKNAVFSEAKMKEILGGDPSSARDIFRVSGEFLPCCNLFMTTNHLPKNKDDSFGAKRRIIVLQLKNRFKQDDSFDVWIKESPAVNAFIMMCYKASKAYKSFTDCLNAIPEEIKEATDAYNKEYDSIGQWLDLCNYVKSDKNKRVELKKVYDCYKNWCDDEEIKPALKRDFKNTLKRKESLEIKVSQVKDGLYKKMCVFGLSLPTDNSPATFTKKVVGGTTQQPSKEGNKILYETKGN